MKKSLFPLLYFVVISCKHEHEEEKYSCQIDGTSLHIAADFQKAPCDNLPPEGIKIKITGLTVPPGQDLRLRFYTNPNVPSTNLNDAGGLELKFTDSQVGADFAQGEPATSNAHTGANSFCIEIHDITKEKHTQIFSGDECQGNLTLNHSESTAPTPATRAVSYRRPDSGVIVGQIKIEKEKHGHEH
ncbi:MAG: hypothetical protein NZM25_03065 [Leptospiraceae bacterium]|nr:hypothetical protein [Leptospiraceae bacterium]MDW8307250.1 hypothetical protein [Leptospiraceae bacterium]